LAACEQQLATNPTESEALLELLQQAVDKVALSESSPIRVPVGQVQKLRLSDVPQDSIIGPETGVRYRVETAIQWVWSDWQEQPVGAERVKTLDHPLITGRFVFAPRPTEVAEPIPSSEDELTLKVLIRAVAAGLEASRELKLTVRVNPLTVPLLAALFNHNHFLGSLISATITPAGHAFRFVNSVRAADNDPAMLARAPRLFLNAGDDASPIVRGVRASSPARVIVCQCTGGPL